MTLTMSQMRSSRSLEERLSHGIAENRKQETAKDESDGNQHDKNKNINKKKQKAMHFSNLTVEEAYSKFDIYSNIFLFNDCRVHLWHDVMSS